MAKTSRKPTQSKAKTAPRTTGKVGIRYLHPSIRETALRYAKGDPRRIEVISETQAVVR